jgi:hypothetical protein
MRKRVLDGTGLLGIFEMIFYRIIGASPVSYEEWSIRLPGDGPDFLIL